MWESAKWRGIKRRVAPLAGLCALLAAAWLAVAAGADQPASDSVGLIDGDDIAVTGPMSVELFAGRTKTILHSGSDVRVKSGQARISLVEGGQVTICGPAHFSVLKAGGSLTIALESGVLHALMEREPALTLYTAQIQAQPVAIGDEPRELLLGFESPALMCLRTLRGALRLEQQLTGQSVIVPQGGDMLLTNGQIDSLTSGGEHCHCELQIAKAATPPSPVGAQAPSDAPAQSASAEAVPMQTASARAEQAPATEKPAVPEGQNEIIYQVSMPPLVFDAKAKVQPAPDPSIMVIVKRVRVRPELVFRGRVENEQVATAEANTSLAPETRAPQTSNAAAPPRVPQQPDGSVTDRVRSFLRRLWSHSS